ncbi:MAG: helix-turn-helix domain-containing protein [Microcoleaceae cyanobacterium]
MNLITLTYQYKVKPSKQQELDISQIFNVWNNIYNYALIEPKDWLSFGDRRHETKKSPIYCSFNCF